MDPTLAKEKGIKINGWVRDLTFPKFIMSMIVFGTIFWVRMSDHASSKPLHLDTEKEQTAMSIISQYDMTRGANLRLIQLEHEIEAIKVILARYEQQGKLQTPEQKKELIREVIKEMDSKK